MTKRARKRLFLVIFIIVIGAGAFGGFRYWRSVQTERMIEEKYRLGQQYYEMGDYENALRNWSYYVGKRRDDGETLMKFAECRLNVPKPNDAHIREGTGLLKEAATLQPDNPEPLRKLLDLYLRLGYLTERLDTCNRLLRLVPNDPEALMAKVQTLDALGGRQREALEAAEQLVAADPDNSEAHEWKLIILSRRDGSEDEMIEYADALAEEHPDDPSFMLLKAQAYAQVGRIDDAKAVARAAADLKYRDPEELRYLVELLDRLGLSTLADEKLSLALEDFPVDSDISTVIIERAWKSGNRELAENYLPADDAPIDDLSDEMLGWTAFVQQSTDTPIDTNDAFLELSTRKSEDAQFWTLVLRGRQAMIEADWIEARKELRQAAVKRNRNALVSLMLGETNRALAENDRALSWLELAVQEDPMWAAPRQLLALSYLDAGRLPEAREQAEAAFDLGVGAGRGASELTVLAEVYLQLLEIGRGDAQRTRTATEVLKQILEQIPDNPSLMAIVARALIITDDVSGAENLIQRLIDEDLVPSTEELLNLVDACNQHGLPYGDELLSLGGREDTSNVRLLLRLANRSAQQGQFEAGRQFLQNSIEAAVDERQKLERQLALATYLDTHGNREALDQLKQLAEENTESAIAQRVLLDSRSAWLHEDAVAPAIERLRTLTGEDATGWKKYEARRLLTFDPTPNNASRVAELLLPIVRSNPADTRAQALYAHANVILDDPGAAIRALGTAVDSNLLEVTLYPRLIELLKEAGRVSEAEQRLLEFANRYIPLENLALRRQRAELLAESALWDRAIEEMEAVAEVGQPSDRAFLAGLYRRSGQPEKAKQAYEEAVALPDASQSVIGDAANFFARIGEYDRGLELLNDLPESVSELDKNLMIAAYMEQAGKTESAQQLLEETANTTDSPRAWAALARYMMRQQRYPDAEDAVQRGLGTTPDDRDLQSLNSLLSALQGGEIQENIIDQLGGNTDPESREAYRKLLAADKFLRDNPDDRAGYLTRLREVTSAHPSVYAGWDLLTTEFLNQGYANEAMNAAQNAAQVLPASAQAAQLAARTMITFRRYDMALSYANRWRELTLDNPFDADVTIAFIQWSLDRIEPALARIEAWRERILREKEEEPDSFELYVTLLAGAGRVDEAHELLWPLAQDDPQWAAAYARIAEQIESIDEATDWLARAETLAPDDTEVLGMVVMEYYKLAQRVRTNEAFQKVIDVASSEYEREGFVPAVIMMIADAHQQLVQMDDAERLYRLGVEREPNNALGLNNLAYLLYLVGDVDGDAEDFATRAVNLAKEFRFNSSTQANFMETLGLILNTKGEYENALVVLEEASSLDPANPSVFLDLTEAYLATDQNDRARSSLATVDRLLQRPDRQLSDREQARLEEVRRKLGG